MLLPSTLLTLPLQQGPEAYRQEETVRNLQRLAAAMEGLPWVKTMKVVDTAVVPVIKVSVEPFDTAVHSPGTPPGDTDLWLGSGGDGGLIPLDISFASPMHGGLASSRWVREYVGSGKYALCLPATLVLKELLCQRGLNQPWSGGLSSYSLINMMVTVLQEVEKQRVQDRKLEVRARALRAPSDEDFPPAGPVLPASLTRQQQQQQQPTVSNGRGNKRNGSSGNSTSGAAVSSSGGNTAAGTAAAATAAAAAATSSNSSSAILPVLAVDVDSAGYEMMGATEAELEAEDLSDVTPGACLLKFLEFYGRAFDSINYGISVGRGRLGNPFVMEHPIDPRTGVPSVAAITIEVRACATTACLIMLFECMLGSSAQCSIRRSLVLHSTCKHSTCCNTMIPSTLRVHAIRLRCEVVIAFATHLTGSNNTY
jgi:hypothetical protein